MSTSGDRPHADFSNYVTSTHVSVASRIITSDFGAVSESIITQLLLYGTQTLAELAHATSLPAPPLRNALLMLIQQNLVHATLKPSARKAGKGGKGEGGGMARVAYEARLDEVLARRWTPRLLVIVRERHGSEAALMLKESIPETERYIDTPSLANAPSLLHHASRTLPRFQVS